MAERRPNLRQTPTPPSFAENAIGFLRFLMEHRQYRASLMRKGREFEIL